VGGLKKPGLYAALSVVAVYGPVYAIYPAVYALFMLFMQLARLTLVPP
jgi:hypothetical protein